MRVIVNVLSLVIVCIAVYTLTSPKYVPVAAMGFITGLIIYYVIKITIKENKEIK